MLIGIVVDGDTEFYGIPALTEKLRAAGGHSYLKPARADVYGEPTLEQIVRACAEPVRQQWARGANKVLVLLDWESRDGCPGGSASFVEDRLHHETGARVYVVFKMRMMENWLVADPGAARRYPARFRAWSKKDLSPCASGRADDVDALRLLKKYTVGAAYDKVRDGKKLAESLSLEDAAANSRSFRRLMRVAGHPSYQSQSRNVAA